MMDRIIAEVEGDPYYRTLIDASQSPPESNIADAICTSLRQTASLVPVAVMVTYTRSGYTCLRAARELAGRARDIEAVREASTALDNLPEWAMFNAMLTGMLSPSTETALTQEEIAHIIERERQSRTTPQFTATSTPRKRHRSKPPRLRLPRGLLEDIFSFFPFED